jgi:RNA polymerase sigma-70 factor (ECF subfamily)
MRANTSKVTPAGACLDGTAPSPSAYKREQARRDPDQPSWPGSNEHGVGAGRVVDLSKCSDEQLMVIALDDSSAFAVLYDRYEGALLRFFRRATGRADVAADLTAEVFASALESLERYRPEIAPARSWLYGIARHELAQAWRQGKAEKQARERVGMQPIVIDDDDLARIEELEEAASYGTLELLGELAGDQREAITGRVLEGRDYSELAGELGCSEMVVRKRVSRGLRSLRNQVRRTR